MATMKPTTSQRVWLRWVSWRSKNWVFTAANYRQIIGLGVRWRTLAMIVQRQVRPV